MQKKGNIIIVLVFLCILFVSIASAFSFGDFWGKISGKAVEDTQSTTKVDWINCVDVTNGVMGYYRKKVVFFTRIVTKTYLDTCQDENVLKQYSCNGNIPAFQEIECGGVCEDGKCKDVPLAINFITPNVSESIVEAYNANLEVEVFTTKDAECGYALYARVAKIAESNFTIMEETGGKIHRQLIPELEDGQGYFLVIECTDANGVSVTSKADFTVKIPIIKGTIGIITDSEIYEENEKIGVVS